MTIQQCLDYVKEYAPALLVIEAFTPSINDDLNFSKLVKEQVDCKIALCGVHASALPQEMLKNDCIDFVLLKDFDLPLKELCHALKLAEENFEPIKSLAFKRNGSIVINPINQDIINYDELPFPDRDELPVQKYNEPLSTCFPNARISSTRGCPFSCKFCIEPFMYEGIYKKRSVDLVIKEIELLRNRYGIKEIYFDDALFTISRAKEIANALITNNIKIAWTCWIDPRVKPHDLELLVKSGCVAIKIAIESANPEIRNAMGKDRLVNIEKIKSLVRTSKKLKLRTHASFMFGV